MAHRASNNNINSGNIVTRLIYQLSDVQCNQEGKGRPKQPVGARTLLIHMPTRQVWSRAEPLIKGGHYSANISEYGFVHASCSLFATIHHVGANPMDPGRLEQITYWGE